MDLHGCRPYGDRYQHAVQELRAARIAIAGARVSGRGILRDSQIARPERVERPTANIRVSRYCAVGPPGAFVNSVPPLSKTMTARSFGSFCLYVQYGLAVKVPRYNFELSVSTRSKVTHAMLSPVRSEISQCAGP